MPMLLQRTEASNYVLLRLLTVIDTHTSVWGHRLKQRVTDWKGTRQN